MDCSKQTIVHKQNMEAQQENRKVALITGITGQDGSYLAEFLIEKDMRFMVCCAVRHRSIPDVLSIFISTSGCAT